MTIPYGQLEQDEDDPTVYGLCKNNLCSINAFPETILIVNEDNKLRISISTKSGYIRPIEICHTTETRYEI